MNEDKRDEIFITKDELANGYKKFAKNISCNTKKFKKFRTVEIHKGWKNCALYLFRCNEYLNNNKKIKEKNMKNKLVWFLSVFVPSFVFGAGLTKVNDLMEQVETALHAVAVTVITVAAMYVGFKVMSKTSSCRFLVCNSWCNNFRSSS